VWGEKNREERRGVLMEMRKDNSKRIRRYGVNLLYVEINVYLPKSFYYEVTIDMKILLQSVSVAATGRT